MSANQYKSMTVSYVTISCRALCTLLLWLHVCRFGGILLHADRFKHINNVARILLQDTGVGQKVNQISCKTYSAWLRSSLVPRLSWFVHFSHIRAGEMHVKDLKQSFVCISLSCEKKRERESLGTRVGWGLCNCSLKFKIGATNLPITIQHAHHTPAPLSWSWSWR